MKLKLSAPKQITWFVALVLALLGLIGKIATVTFISANAFWLVLIAAALLLLATLLEGL